VKKSLVAVLAVAALVGLGVAGVPVAERYAAGRIKAEIERDGQASVGAVEVGLIDRSVVLSDFRSHALGDLAVRRWELRGMAESLGDLLAGRTPLANFRLGDPLRADHLELADLHIANPSTGATWTVGSLVIDGLDLAAYDADIAGPRHPEILAARIAGALSLQHAEARNASHTLAATGDAVFVRSAAIHRVDRGHIGALAIADIEATPKGAAEASLKVDDIRMKEIGLGRILSQIEKNARYPDSSLGRVDIGSASATGFGGTLLSSNGVSLESISLETVREEVGASRSRLRVEDLALRPAANPTGARLGILLQAMGLSELKLGLDCAGVERRSKGELAIRQCTLSAADLGEMTLSAELTGADETFWRAVDNGTMVALPQSSIALASARLVLFDRGMIDRSVRALAAATNQSSAVARANLAHDIRTYQPPDILITQDMTKLLDTVARFVEEGGTLTLAARPDPPLGLAAASRLSIAGPDLVHLLGLSATLSR
jgi:hypothetical protein